MNIPYRESSRSFLGFSRRIPGVLLQSSCCFPLSSWNLPVVFPISSGKPPQKAGIFPLYSVGFLTVCPPVPDVFPALSRGFPISGAGGRTIREPREYPGKIPAFSDGFPVISVQLPKLLEFPSLCGKTTGFHRKTQGNPGGFDCRDTVCGMLYKA